MPAITHYAMHQIPHALARRAFALFFIIFAFTQYAYADRLPNVILIVADDLGYPHGEAAAC